MLNRLHGREASEVGGMGIVRMLPSRPRRKLCETPLPHKKVYVARITITKTRSVLLMTFSAISVLRLLHYGGWCPIHAALCLSLMLLSSMQPSKTTAELTRWPKQNGQAKLAGRKFCHINPERLQCF